MRIQRNFWLCKRRNLVGEWFIKKVILSPELRMSRVFSTREGRTFLVDK